MTLRFHFRSLHFILSFSNFFTSLQHLFYSTSAVLLLPISIFQPFSLSSVDFFFLFVSTFLVFIFYFASSLNFYFSSTFFLTFLQRFFSIFIQCFCFSFLTFIRCFLFTSLHRFRTFYFKFIFQPRTTRILFGFQEIWTD